MTFRHYTGFSISVKFQVNNENKEIKDRTQNQRSTEMSQQHNMSYFKRSYFFFRDDVRWDRYFSI